MKRYKSEALLLLTACIWGFAFVAQRKGMDHIGPYTYNGIRFAIGSLSLIPLILHLDKVNNRKKLEGNYLQTIIFSCIAGVILFLGASFQQVGLLYTEAGKAGFITGLYVVIVPFIALVFGRKIDAKVLTGAVIAVFGLYFLSITGESNIAGDEIFELIRSGNINSENIKKFVNYGDLLVLICAFFFALHVVLIGWLSNKADPLKISALQFAICSILSMGYALHTETIEMAGIINAAVPILYGGLFSVGVAYTLQVVAQKGADPSKAAIILSLESVFAVIGGIIFLGEYIGGRGFFGCGLMLLGILLAQKKNNKSSKKY